MGVIRSYNKYVSCLLSSGNQVRVTLDYTRLCRQDQFSLNAFYPSLDKIYYQEILENVKKVQSSDGIKT